MSRRFWKTADFPPPLEQPEHRVPRDIISSTSGAVSKVFGGGGGGGTTTTNTIQNSDPWAGVQPDLLRLFGAAGSQFGQGPYSGPFITQQSPYTQQAIAGQAAMAQDPNSLVGQSQRELGNTISGRYLDINNNPAAQEALDAARRNVSSQFSGDNYGGSAHQEWLGRASAGAVSPILMQERQNQLNSLQLAPGLQQANLSQLAGAGAAQEGRGQAEIAAAQQQQQAPWQNLYNYQQALSSGQPYGQQTGAQQNPYFTNPLASGLGGGLAGAGIASAFPALGLTGPWGFGIGAGLGLLGAYR